VAIIPIVEGHAEIGSIPVLLRRLGIVEVARPFRVKRNKVVKPGELERAVGQAIADGAISGNERFPARMTLVVNGLNIDVAFDGEIKLE
jgi:hypothetical protein